MTSASKRHQGRPIQVGGVAPWISAMDGRPDGNPDGTPAAFNDCTGVAYRRPDASSVTS
jgi:hypothetical protein